MLKKMDRKKLLHIIDKNLNELLEINQEMSQSAHLSKLEIDIALAKAKLIFQEYELLQEINSPQTEKAAIKFEATPVAENSPTLFDLPPATPVKTEVENHQHATIKNDLKEVEIQLQPAVEAEAEPVIEVPAPPARTTEAPVKEEVMPETPADPKPVQSGPIDLPAAEKEAKPVDEHAKVEVEEKDTTETQTVEKIKTEEKPVIEKAVEKFQLQEEKPLKPEPIQIEEPVKKTAPVAELVTPAASASEKILEKETLPKNGTSKTDLQEKKTVTDQFQAKSLNDTISSSNKLDQRLASTPIQKLENSIGLNDRFQYIRELFNNDADLFRDTISKIDKMHTIEEALDFLDSQFEWEMDDTSLKFIHLVRRRFSV